MPGIEYCSPLLAPEPFRPPATPIEFREPPAAEACKII